MSDGPYRSLKMRPAWKKVAKFADMRAAASEDVEAAVSAAFASDWRKDVDEKLADCISDVLGDQQDSLLRDQKILQLEALRPLTVGKELAQVFLECAIQRAASDAPPPDDSAVVAAKDALDIWGSRQGRHIEEHFHRESTERRAGKVRNRIEQGISGTSRESLARQFLKREPRNTTRTPTKHTGLDDGVPL